MRVSEFSCFYLSILVFTFFVHFYCASESSEWVKSTQIHPQGITEWISNSKQITNRIIALSVINLTTWHDNKVLIAHAQHTKKQTKTIDGVICYIRALKFMTRTHLQQQSYNYWEERALSPCTYSCIHTAIIYLFIFIAFIMSKAQIYIFLHDVILRFHFVLYVRLTATNTWYVLQVKSHNRAQWNITWPFAMQNFTVRPQQFHRFHKWSYGKRCKTNASRAGSFAFEKKNSNRVPLAALSYILIALVLRISQKKSHCSIYLAEIIWERHILEHIQVCMPSIHISAVCLLSVMKMSEWTGIFNGEHCMFVKNWTGFWQIKWESFCCFFCLYHKDFHYS